MDYEALKQLERIIKVTYSISNLYKKLYELEIKGLKNNEDYQKYLNYLKVVLEIEKKYYNKDRLDTKTMYIMSDFLENVTGIDEYNIEMLVNEKQEEPSIIARIQSNLFLECTNNYNDINNFLLEEELKILEDYYRQNSIGFISFDVFSKFEFYVEKDFKIAFLYFLEKFIRTSSYSNVRERLIENKYKFIFMNKDIEDLALENEFNIDEIFKSNFDALKQYLKVDTDTVAKIKNNYTEIYYLNYVSKLLGIDDIDYNENKNFILSILAQCFIRASFTLMSEDLIDKLNYNFHECVQRNDYLDKNSNNEISQNLIIECFKKIRKDRKHTRILKTNV